MASNLMRRYAKVFFQSTIVVITMALLMLGCARSREYRGSEMTLVVYNHSGKELPLRSLSRKASSRLHQLEKHKFVELDFNRAHVNDVLAFLAKMSNDAGSPSKGATGIVPREVLLDHARRLQNTPRWVHDLRLEEAFISFTFYPCPDLSLLDIMLHVAKTFDFYLAIGIEGDVFFSHVADIGSRAKKNTYYISPVDSVYRNPMNCNCGHIVDQNVPIRIEHLERPLGPTLDN